MLNEQKVEFDDIKLDYDFYDKVEDPNYLEKILYSDTDSLFIHVLSDEQLKKLELDITKREDLEKISDEIVEPLSNIINKAIQHYWNKNFLDKLNVSEEWNTIDFKIEMIISKIFFPGVKKRYAYLVHKKEKTVYDPPELKVSGIEIKRSDTAKITKELMKKFLHIIFNTEPKNLRKELLNFIKEIKEKIRRIKQSYDFESIGIPSSWSIREYNEIPTYVYGAMLYNLLIKDVIRPGTKGYRIHIAINKRKLKELLKSKNKDELSQYQLNLNLFEKIEDKLNVIFLPPDYNVSDIKRLEEEKIIKIDWETQINKVIREKLEDFIQFANEVSS